MRMESSLLLQPTRCVVRREQPNVPVVRRVSELRGVKASCQIRDRVAGEEGEVGEEERGGCVVN